MQIFNLRNVFTFCLIIFFASSTLLAQETSKFESVLGLEEPEDYKNRNEASEFLELKEKKDEIKLPKPIGGYGDLHIVIESINAANPRLFSKKASSIEIWLGHNRLLALDEKNPKVTDINGSRIFDFPLISLKTGYYFISVRLYSQGIIWKNKKYHEEIFQIGVHEGKRTNLRRKIPFFNW